MRRLYADKITAHGHLTAAMTPQITKTAAAMLAPITSNPKITPPTMPAASIIFTRYPPKK